MSYKPVMLEISRFIAIDYLRTMGSSQSLPLFQEKKKKEKEMKIEIVSNLMKEISIEI